MAGFKDKLRNLAGVFMLAAAPCVVAAENAANIWQNEDLYHYLPSDEIKPLLAGEDEFLTLYRPHSAAIQRGVMLLVPDLMKPPAGNGDLDFFRKHFNDLGYATLALTAPGMPDVKQEAQASAEETGGTTQTEKATAPVEPRFSDAQLDDARLALRQRFVSAYQVAAEEGGQIILLAEGASAALLLEYFSTLPAEAPQAIISISAALPNFRRNNQLAASISLVAPALLDLYFAMDNPAVSHSREERLRWVRKNHKYDYRQRQLFGAPDAREQHLRMAKEIYGFLRSL